MSDKPKRRWFQISLSSAIVMMCAAGLLIRENVKRAAIPAAVYGAAHHELGWPWVGLYYWTPNLAPVNGTALVEQRYLDYRLLFADFAVAILTTVVLGAASEFIMRRREAKHK